MKLLFFSTDDVEVEQVRSDLVRADIPCELRPSPILEGVSPSPGCVELWVQKDEDVHRALMRCVELGIGFSRRSARDVWVDGSWAQYAEAQVA